MENNVKIQDDTQSLQSCVSVSAFLTGKAKQDFEVFQIHRSLAITNADRLENYKLDFKDLEPYSHHIWRMDEVYLIALIIEWLDTVNLQITTETIQGGEFRCFVLKDKLHHFWIDDRFESRKKASISAIQKADELFNDNVVQAEH